MQAVLDDQYNIFHVLINNSRTTLPTKILMPFCSFSHNLLSDADIMLQISVDSFDIQHMINFGLRCSSILTGAKHR